MDKNERHKYIYVDCGVLLHGSKGKEAKAINEANDIIQTIKKINPDFEEDASPDTVNTENEAENENKNADWYEMILQVFKDGPLSWKPTLDVDHKHSCDGKPKAKFVSAETESKSNEVIKRKMCGSIDAAIEAKSGGHVRFSLGDKKIATAEYDAELKGKLEGSCLGFSDKITTEKGYQRRVTVAKCKAKCEVEGRVQGSAEINAFNFKRKIEAHAKLEADGKASFLGVQADIKKNSKGIEGKVKVLHAKAQGKAQFQAKASEGKNKVELKARADGKVKFKAFDGKLVLAAKKRKDGGIYIPGIKGEVGHASAVCNAEYEFETDINGKKLNKKGKISGKAKLCGLKFKTLGVNITDKKDYGNSIKATAKLQGLNVNLLNVDAAGERKGSKVSLSADVTGAQLNVGNVSATGIDNTNTTSAKVRTGFSANIGNIKMQGLGHTGVKAEADLRTGVNMFNMSIGISRDTEISASAKFSVFNINLTVGPPRLNFGFGACNIGIPFFSGGGGGGGGGVVGGSGGNNDKGVGSDSSKSSEDGNGGGESIGTTGHCDNTTSVEGCSTYSLYGGAVSSYYSDCALEGGEISDDVEVGGNNGKGVGCDSSKSSEDGNGGGESIGTTGHYDNTTSVEGCTTDSLYGGAVSSYYSDCAVEGGEISDDVEVGGNNDKGVGCDSSKSSEDGNDGEESIGTTGHCDNTTSVEGCTTDSLYGGAVSDYYSDCAVEGGEISDDVEICDIDKVSDYDGMCKDRKNGAHNRRGPKQTRNVEEKHLQGQIFENRAFDEVGNITSSKESDLLIVIDQTETNDICSIVEALDAEEVDPNKPFTNQMYSQDILEEDRVASRNSVPLHSGRNVRRSTPGCDRDEVLKLSRAKRGSRQTSREMKNVDAVQKKESEKTSTESKYVETNLENDCDYNRYLASIVDKRVLKSKDSRSTKSRKSSIKDFTQSTWQDKEKLKSALIDKYTKKAESEQNALGKESKRKVEIDTRDKNGAESSESGHIQDDYKQIQSKKKEEPKKPFGANKNIHTIFTLDGTEGRSVKYLSKNVVCFGED